MATAAIQQTTTHHPSAQKPTRQPNQTRSPPTRIPASSPVKTGLPHDDAHFPRSASYTYLPHNAVTPRYNDEPGVLTIEGLVEDAEFLTKDANEAIDISPPESSGSSTPDEALSIPPSKVPRAHEIIAELKKRPLVELLEKRDEQKENVKQGSYAISSLRGEQRDKADETEQDVDSAIEIAEEVTPGQQETNIRLSSSSLSRPAARRANTAPAVDLAEHGRSIGKTLSKRFTRGSWYPSRPTTPTSSRSPSPSKDLSAANHALLPSGSPTRPPKAIRRQSILRRRDPTKLAKAPKEASSVPVGAQSPEASLVRRATRMGKRASRPVSGLLRLVTSDFGESLPRGFTSSSSTDLRRSYSSEQLSGVSPHHASFDRSIPVPRIGNLEKTLASPIPLAKKRDELWTVFRTLDADYTKFASKSVSLKANVVRSSLLPFLRHYASHPSNQGIRPEDLDRRANILNKWWVGLSEMLEGGSNLSISGTDRPVILDGISGIMERPEWRQPPSPFSPLAQRVNRPSLPCSRSSSSLGSTMSEFLVESIHHNVRNMFVRNLSSQMTFVVEKMSLRHASASLVTFCGKACAYAFMFVPGLADVLVRLWQLPMEVMRRVLNENGVNKFERIPDSAYDLMSSFPPPVQTLAFTSLMAFMRKLRSPPPPLLVGMQHVDWRGHWLERWSGRDSDLFYVFVKYFHVLAAEFLSPNASQRDRIYAPGFLLVHAQMLVNLDATIHRHASPAHHLPSDAHTAVSGASATNSATSDDMLENPDAVASALPVAPTNPARLMAENRLIMLIRDMLSDRENSHHAASDMFAVSFNAILQAGARGTFLYDHAACYTLLDLLEEAFVIMVRFENSRGIEGRLVDMAFWIEVYRKLVRSENTMTEIRLYSFLHTMWTTLASDASRRRALTLDLLLDPVIFDGRFEHWCPMVRAYYMRLLCWRVARFDGDVGQDGSDCMGDDDRCILETLLNRLSSSWSAHASATAASSTVDGGLSNLVSQACLPAPGRRLVIVRTDKVAAAASSFMSFDGILTTRSPLKQNSSRQRVEEMQGVTDNRVDSHSKQDLEQVATRSNSFGGLFRKMMMTGASRLPPPPPTTSIREAPPEQSLDTSPSEAGPSTVNSAHGTPQNRPDIAKPANSATTSTSNDNISNASSTTTSTSKPPPSSFSVRPGLSRSTTAQYRSLSFKFSLEPLPPGKAYPPPLRIQPPRLPVPAQTALQFVGSPAVAPIALKSGPRISSIPRPYAGRALAEWMLVLGESHCFFERRRAEGVPTNRAVETPVLGVEVLRRPG